MRFLVIVLLAFIAGSTNAADDSLVIECVRAGSVSLQELQATAAEGGSLHCRPPPAGARAVPSFAMGESIALVLKDTPDCDPQRPYLLLVDGMSTGIVNTGCNGEKKTILFTLSHVPSVQTAWPVDEKAVRVLWQRILGNPWEAPGWQRASWMSVQHPGRRSSPARSRS